jgi:4-amino-4-deoxy-L-arabinose transferase-like glycosyltransferase
VPSPTVLTIARVPSALAFFLSAIVVLWLAFRLTSSRLAAYGSALVYATTPAMIVNGARRCRKE